MKDGTLEDVISKGKDGTEKTNRRLVIENM